MLACTARVVARLAALTDSHTLDDSASPPKLLDRVRTAVRVRHYSRRTEQAYVDWIRRYILFHKKRHPSTMGTAEISAFLAWLAVQRRVSASTQNQALSALLFLYKVLGLDLGPIEHVPRARMPDKLPVVLSREELGQLMKHVDGTMWLIVALLYGTGVRLEECLELRVKDLDFDRNQIVVRRGKGQKDRMTMLPAGVKERLAAHVVTVKRQHERDLARGEGRVVLPFALDRKYPGAPTEWGWQFVFPASRICRDPKWGPPSRFHLHESAVQRAVTMAVRRAGLTKHASCHSMRHSFATHLLEDGYDSEWAGVPRSAVTPGAVVVGREACSQSR
jgi:integron integrase